MSREVREFCLTHGHIDHFLGNVYEGSEYCGEALHCPECYPDHPDHPANVAVTAASKLSRAALLESANNGKELGTCDED